MGGLWGEKGQETGVKTGVRGDEMTCEQARWRDWGAEEGGKSRKTGRKRRERRGIVSLRVPVFANAGQKCGWKRFAKKRKRARNWGKEGPGGRRSQKRAPRPGVSGRWTRKRAGVAVRSPLCRRLKQALFVPTWLILKTVAVRSPLCRRRKHVPSQLIACLNSCALKVLRSVGD